MIIKQKYSLLKTILVIAVLFNVALPKGGFAVANIPITWGYIILFLIIGFSLIRGLSIKKLSKLKLEAILSSLPFTFYFIAYLFYVKEYPPTGFVVSLILNIVVFPVVFLLFFDRIIKYILKNDEFFHKIILRAILFISVFGLFLFFYRIKVGSYFEIPYVTVNIKDYGLSNSKYNLRFGSLSKLISTYSNGNIFGICMFFLLPFTKKHKLHKTLLKIAMVLTLSRTVWAGMLIYEVISNRKHFVKMIYIGATILSIIIFVMIFVLNVDANFIFDSSLGGRLKGEGMDVSIFFHDKVFYGINEMTYKDMLAQMGVIGLLLFIMQIFTPVCLSFKRNIKRINENQKQLRVGVLTYLIVAFIDGAYLFIPVSLFFWFSSAYIISTIPENIENE